MVAEKAPKAPVTDWASDYDIFSETYIKDPFPIWDGMREKCPVAHSDRYLGSWMPTRYEDLFAIAQDFQHFSSRDIIVAPFGDPNAAYNSPPGDRQFDEVAAPPITADPPLHTWTRRLLLPQFSIRAVEKFEALTREHCRELIDGFIAEGKADAAADYAQQIPPFVIATMLGVPRDMTSTFTQWVRDILEFGFVNPQGAIDARSQLLSYFWNHIQDRRQNPTDDLVSYLATAKVNDEPIPDREILGFGFLIIVAGIDTTWSSIGSALWHLAQHPSDRARIINEPGIINAAVEELLRAYSAVTMARYVAEDVDYKGCPMKEGDRVIMNFPAGNRDPRKFKDPDKVIIDRAENPHIAFGAGIHRCAGSNLARMEMRVAIQEWLARIPDFELADPSAVTWAGGQVRGPRKLPVKFPAGGQPK